MKAFVWLCLAAAAIIPEAQSVLLQEKALERRVCAELEAAALARPGAAIGAAGGFVRQMTPTLALRG
jgi:hypothetical protein